MSAVLTLVFWALWIYLWLPVIGMLGWAFGVSRFYDEMIRLEGYRTLLGVLGWYSLVITALSSCLVCWALYNLGRFRGRERRQARPRVTLVQIGEAAGVNPALLSLWQRARTLRVSHAADGTIDFVESFPELAGDQDPQEAWNPGKRAERAERANRADSRKSLPTVVPQT